MKFLVDAQLPARLCDFLIGCGHDAVHVSAALQDGNRSSDASIAAVAGDWRVDRVDEIRSLITQAEPDVVEEIKRRTPSNPDGVPAFSLDGLICTLEKYKGKVKVNFAKGSSVNDPDHLFNASLEAPVGRSIDLREDDQVDADAFKALIREAVRVNRS